VSRSGTSDVGSEVEDPDSDEIKFINASSDVSLTVRRRAEEERVLAYLGKVRCSSLTLKQSFMGYLHKILCVGFECRR
jgi:hypothetical protein